MAEGVQRHPLEPGLPACGLEHAAAQVAIRQWATVGGGEHPAVPGRSAPSAHSLFSLYNAAGPRAVVVNEVKGHPERYASGPRSSYASTRAAARWPCAVPASALSAGGSSVRSRSVRIGRSVGAIATITMTTRFTSGANAASIAPLGFLPLLGLRACGGRPLAGVSPCRLKVAAAPTVTGQRFAGACGGRFHHGPKASSAARMSRGVDPGVDPSPYTPPCKAPRKRLFAGSSSSSSAWIRTRDLTIMSGAL